MNCRPIGAVKVVLILLRAGLVDTNLNVYLRDMQGDQSEEGELGSRPRQFSGFLGAIVPAAGLILGLSIPIGTSVFWTAYPMPEGLRRQANVKFLQQSARTRSEAWGRECLRAPGAKALYRGGDFRAERN